MRAGPALGPAVQSARHGTARRPHPALRGPVDPPKLGETLGAEILAAGAALEGSPWSRLATLAETRLGDTAGLSPWWVLPGAQVKRHVFARPFGRDAGRYDLLRRQRFLYRLALGQPNQEDLLEILARSDRDLLAILEGLTLELCPFRQGKVVDRTPAPIDAKS